MRDVFNGVNGLKQDTLVTHTLLSCSLRVAPPTEMAQ